MLENQNVAKKGNVAELRVARPTILEIILVPRAHDPFGQYRASRPLAGLFFFFSLACAEYWFSVYFQPIRFLRFGNERVGLDAWLLTKRNLGSEDENNDLYVRLRLSTRLSTSPHFKFQTSYLRFQNRRSFLLPTSRDGGSRNKIGVTHYYLKHANKI